MSAFTTESVHKWFLGFHMFIHQMDYLEPLRRFYPKPTPNTSLVQLARHHEEIKQRFLSLPDVRDGITRAIDHYNQAVWRAPPHQPASNSSSSSAREAFRTNGYATLPALSDDVSAKMHAYFASRPALDAKSGEERDLHLLRKSQGIAYFSPQQILNCPHLFESFLAPEVLDVVCHHLGATPTIINLSTWWSFAGAEALEGPQQFHFDYDDLKFCKVFFYLTDVDETSGPHVFVEGSQDFDIVTQAHANCPDGPAAFTQWYRVQLRKSDAEVERYFPNNKAVQITGQRGTRFIANTFGLHKGQQPTARDRLLCQATFGVSPLIPKGVTPLPIGTPDTENVWPEAARGANAWTTRLFLTSDA